MSACSALCEGRRDHTSAGRLAAGYASGLIPVDRSIHGCGASGYRRRIAPRSPPWAIGLPIEEPMIGTSCMFADLALVAVVIEAMVGYPDALYRLIGHPVSWMGRFITWCDDTWNSAALSPR